MVNRAGVIFDAVMWCISEDNMSKRSEDGL